MHIELRSETHGAQHSNRIFAVARFRIADQANHAFLQILHPADVIAHGKIRHAVVKAVDGEIAALGIFFDRAEDVVAQQHTVLPTLGGRTVAFTAFMMTTKRCHFDNFRAKHHVSQAETTSHQTAIAE
ncbi:Uncharacterised protein [Salmonella enterica subsp. enterica serovar Typhimurium str. DT104]|nr:Uncharacterised protein [Salmonella enterica subsp. enterica serovar Typhimurium str. DT104]